MLDVHSPLTTDHSPLNTRCETLAPVFVVGGLYSLSSGVAWIMRDLAAALGRAGSPVTVCAADCPDRGMASVGHLFQPPTRWVTKPGRWMGGLSWAPRLKAIIEDAVAVADVVHNHSLWMLPNSYSSRAARRRHKPIVITAHGALEPWALHNAGWKKRLAGRLFQNEELRQADCLHVNSEAEIVGIRQYGLTGPVAVIPNGIDLRDDESLPSATAFSERFPKTAGRRILLFMARLHEKKGLGHLIPAWGRVAAEFPDWHLVIAGPDNGYGGRAAQLVRELQLADRVTLAGPLHGVEKREALAAAELFVQPSFSEGFSLAIVEALGYGRPVLLTPDCNFREAVDCGAAVEVAPAIESTECGLRELLGLSPAALAAMGEAGRALVQEKYTWDNVAEQTLQMYRWLVDGNAMPDFVVTD